MSKPDFLWAWEDPTEAAARYGRGSDSLVFLHSALPSPQARYSYLALDALEIIQADDWNVLAQRMDALPEARWFGFAGYELGARPFLLQPLPATTALPAQWWMRPRSLLRFDQGARRIEGWGVPPIRSFPPPESALARCIALGSHVSAARYRQQVAAILEDISAGEYYQANLTRKFFGRLQTAPDPMALFAQLCTISPAPFAALIRTPAWSIVSSSMEEFLHIENGQARARPIKGTAPRGGNSREDEERAAALRASAKDRAENTMIVDLMRHDFAQFCEPGSVRADTLCSLESYAQLHHLVSTIEGRLREGIAPLDALRACLPPGSMTGAPKRASLRRLAELERLARGPYSGCLGWISPREAQTSVIIRTLILEGTRFEFQVGGGIVQDSYPWQEWRETLTKARGLAALLSIPFASLESL